MSPSTDEPPDTPADATPEVVASAPPLHRPPVFVDDLGRRRRRIRAVSMVIMAALTVTFGAVVVAVLVSPDKVAEPTNSVGPTTTTAAAGPFALRVPSLANTSHDGGTCTSVAGKVFLDHDLNGARSSDEPGVPGLTIDGFDRFGAPVAHAVSSADGTFTIAAPTPVPLRLEMVLPAGDYAFGPLGLDSDGAQAFPESPACAVSIGVAGVGPSVRRDAAMEVGGRVWTDANCDGVADPGEGPLSGVGMEIRSSTGEVLATTVTDVRGRFVFGGIVAGTDYQVAPTTAATSGILAGLRSSLPPTGDGHLDGVVFTRVSGAVVQATVHLEPVGRSETRLGFGFADPQRCS